MALIQVNFNSKTLMRPVPINVILPIDKLEVDGSQEKVQTPFKTLYLLHGVLGNYTDWMSRTNISRWAEEKNLAVVMPSGDNSFYVDNEKTFNFYGEYVGKELVEMTRKMFPLSHKREDTFIAGLSMGGYGALRNGLKYSDTFGCIAGLSSALLVEEMDTWTNNAAEFYHKRDFAESIFGDLTAAKESDKNPRWIAAKKKEEKAQIPKIYMACGTEDFLLEQNRSFQKALKEMGIDVTYEEGPGCHEWDFWDRYIKRVLDWLPLNKDEGENVL